MTSQCLIQSGKVPDTCRDTDKRNEELHGDHSQSDPQPEVNETDKRTLCTGIPEPTALLHIGSYHFTEVCNLKRVHCGK